VEPTGREATAVDPELKTFLQDMERRMLAQIAAGDAALRGEIEATRRQLEAGTEDTRRQLEVGIEETRRQLEDTRRQLEAGIEETRRQLKDTRRQLEAGIEETRRHMDVLHEATLREVRLVAENVALLRERIDNRFEEQDRKWDGRIRAVEAAVANHETRIRALEQRDA
jgi:phage shock protein A